MNLPFPLLLYFSFFFSLSTFKDVQMLVANQLEFNYKAWSSIKILEKERKFS